MREKLGGIGEENRRARPERGRVRPENVRFGENAGRVGESSLRIGGKSRRFGAKSVRPRAENAGSDKKSKGFDKKSKLPAQKSVPLCQKCVLVWPECVLASNSGKFLVGEPVLTAAEPRPSRLRAGVRTRWRSWVKREPRRSLRPTIASVGSTAIAQDRRLTSLTAPD